MKIPKVENDQIVLVFAESKTGIILNQDGKYYIGEGENYYIIKDDLLSAREFAVREIQAKNGKIEFLLYNNQGSFIEVIR